MGIDKMVPGSLSRGIRYGSVCDGMGAAHVASSGLGWECRWLAEIDPVASAVTAHHYPDVPNLGDITAADFIDRASAMGRLMAAAGLVKYSSTWLTGMRQGRAEASALPSGLFLFPLEFIKTV
jgi:DNA (cytosine-5)-methyltransferase 1